MSVSTDNILYGVVREPSNSYSTIFTFNVANDEFYYYEIETVFYAITLTWLQNREIFVSVRPASSSSDLNMIRANFANHTYTWYKKLDCSGISCSSEQSSVV